MSDFSLDDLGGDSLPQSGDRLQILSPEEYELLWGFPRFTQSDRDLFFTLTAPERDALVQRRSVRTKIHFLCYIWATSVPANASSALSSRLSATTSTTCAGAILTTRPSPT